MVELVDGAPAVISLTCAAATCTEAECEAAGIVCPFCLGANRNCATALGGGNNNMACPVVPDCSFTTTVMGRTLCNNCDEGTGGACMALAATGLVPDCPRTSILARPACGIIEEVECPQPEYIKNVLY